MFRGAGRPLSETGLSRASNDIGVGLPALWSVMTVETKGCGFLPDRRPQILFERHVFHKRTNGNFDAVAPDLSNPTAGGYGAIGGFQHDRLDRAIALDRTAALESASWGLGQVMGFNSTVAGFSTIEKMVSAMCESEDFQVQAMSYFISGNRLAKYLHARDWASFASHYNGPDFRKNEYDTRLAEAHARYLTGPLPSLKVRAAQLYLTYLSYSPGAVDGWLGQNTSNALSRFQKDNALAITGQLDGSTFTKLEYAALR